MQEPPQVWGSYTWLDVPPSENGFGLDVFKARFASERDCRESLDDYRFRVQKDWCNAGDKMHELCQLLKLQEIGVPEARQALLKVAKEIDFPEEEIMIKFAWFKQQHLGEWPAAVRVRVGELSITISLKGKTREEAMADCLTRIRRRINEQSPFDIMEAFDEFRLSKFLPNEEEVRIAQEKQRKEKSLTGAATYSQVCKEGRLQLSEKGDYRFLCISQLPPNHAIATVQNPERKEKLKKDRMHAMELIMEFTLEIVEQILEVMEQMDRMYAGEEMRRQFLRFKITQSLMTCAVQDDRDHKLDENFVEEILPYATERDSKTLEVRIAGYLFAFGQDYKYT
jgi:hypothetical protein